MLTLFRPHHLVPHGLQAVFRGASTNAQSAHAHQIPRLAQFLRSAAARDQCDDGDVSHGDNSADDTGAGADLRRFVCDCGGQCVVGRRRHFQSGELVGQSIPQEMWFVMGSGNIIFPCL